MEQLINTLVAEPIYGAIAILLATLILYSLVKKVIKMMVFFVLIFGLYLAYVGLTGREIPTDQEKLKETLMQDVDKAKEKLKESSSDLVDQTKEKIKEGVKEGTKEALKDEIDKKKKDLDK